VIHFCKEKNSATEGTSLDRGARIVELLFQSIEVSDGVAKDPRAIGSAACMEGANLFAILFKHLVLHRDMMKIAEGGELFAGGH
jgi:hypothetical protein